MSDKITKASMNCDNKTMAYREGVPPDVAERITSAENKLASVLKIMYTCPKCGGEMYTTKYPIVACPECGHEQIGTNSK